MLMGNPDEMNWLRYVFTSPTKPVLGSKAVGKSAAGLAAATVGAVEAVEDVVAAGDALACVVSLVGLVAEVGDANCGSALACAEAA
jgi:hypothetical protein